ncbi:hypothetical protein Bbelb_105130 [Branchiostoma belcheri]|nr:hypothetical protein Bbelb_105130 [Branchiostoma belcheri]
MPAGRYLWHHGSRAGDGRFLPGHSDKCHRHLLSTEGRSLKTLSRTRKTHPFCLCHCHSTWRQSRMLGNNGPAPDGSRTQELQEATESRLSGPPDKLFCFISMMTAATAGEGIRTSDLEGPKPRPECTADALHHGHDKTGRGSRDIARCLYKATEDDALAGQNTQAIKPELKPSHSPKSKSPLISPDLSPTADAGTYTGEL